MRGLHLARSFMRATVPTPSTNTAGLATAATGNSAVRALRDGAPPPTLVPFSLSPQQALQRFEAFQKQQCMCMHALDPLKDAAMSAELLPFWVFDATASVECRASLGRHVERGNPRSPLVWTPMGDWRVMASQQLSRYDQAHMQVYASYRLRRDLAEGAKVAIADLTAGRPLTLDEACALCVLDVWGVSAGMPAHATATASSGITDSSSSSGGGGSDAASTASSSAGRDAAGGGRTSQSGVQRVQLQAPDMRQAIAWQLCYRQLKRHYIAAAVQYLQETSGVDDVRDLQVRMKVHSRTARLAFAPAYHLAYTYGEKYTPGRGQIVPEQFEALVCGALPPPGADACAGVVAELHPSPAKAQVVAGSAVAGMGLAAVPALGLLAGLDPTGVAWGLADAGFAAFVAGAAAGMVVQRLPQASRNRHMADQVRAEKEFYRQYDSRESGDANAAPDERTLWLWMDADWRKWEGEDPWSWDPKQRQQWAEDLFRQQMQRQLTRRRHLQRLEQQRQRQDEEEDRERQRQAKFGPSYSRAEHFTGGHGADWAGAGVGGGSGRRKRRRDFLGYYRTLGIQLDGDEAVTVDVIKASFKKAALHLHPDRHVGADDAIMKQASDQFRRLQMAYEVLKDPEKRRAYDRGQLMQ